MAKTIFLEKVANIQAGKEVVTMEEYRAIKKVAMNEVEDIVAELLETLSKDRRKQEELEQWVWQSNDFLTKLEDALKQKKGFLLKREIKQTIKITEELRDKRVELVIQYHKFNTKIERELYSLGVDVEEALHQYELGKLERALDIWAPKE
jgi:hypothetical protein